MSSEVILHFDFDPENTFMSNGTQPENIGIETSKEAPQPSSSISSTSDTTEKELRTSTDALHTEPVVCPQKKVIKPPMPPTKETKPPTPEVEPVKEDCPTKKVCKILFNSHNTLFYSSWIRVFLYNFDGDMLNCSSWTQMDFPSLHKL